MVTLFGKKISKKMLLLFTATLASFSGGLFLKTTTVYANPPTSQLESCSAPVGAGYDSTCTNNRYIDDVFNGVETIWTANMTDYFSKPTSSTTYEDYNNQSFSVTMGKPIYDVYVVELNQSPGTILFQSDSSYTGKYLSNYGQIQFSVMKNGSGQLLSSLDTINVNGNDCVYLGCDKYYNEDILG